MNEIDFVLAREVDSSSGKGTRILCSVGRNGFFAPYRGSLWIWNGQCIQLGCRCFHCGAGISFLSVAGEKRRVRSRFVCTKTSPKPKTRKTKIPFPTKQFCARQIRTWRGPQRQRKHDPGSSISYSRDPGWGIAQLRTICYASIYIFHTLLWGEGLDERDKRNTQIIDLASKDTLQWCIHDITVSRMIVRTNIISTFNSLLQ